MDNTQIIQTWLAPDAYTGTQWSALYPQGMLARFTPDGLISVTKCNQTMAEILMAEFVCPVCIAKQNASAVGFACTLVDGEHVGHCDCTEHLVPERLEQGWTHHPTCKKGSAESRENDMAEQPLIERLRQNYFDNLPERWNTDGTRKDLLAVFFQVTGTTPFDATVNISERIIDHSYSPLNPDVAKLKYGEVDFCDQ